MIAGKWFAKVKKWPVGIRAAIVLGVFTIAAAVTSQAFRIPSDESPASNTEEVTKSDTITRIAANQNTHIEGDNVVNQGDGSQIFARDSSVTIQNESAEARLSRKEAELDRKNKKYFVGVSKWIQEPHSAPNGRKRTVRRPEILAVPSATEPKVRLDGKSGKYVVKVSYYVIDEDVEDGMRLEWRRYESDASFGKPTVEENSY